jgi:hypothetical protein
MAVVLLENLRHGMIVAADVKDLNGNILIFKGGEIEDKHEKVLKSYGGLRCRSFRRANGLNYF